MPDRTATPLRGERVVCRELADREAVLLHLTSGQYHSINSTGLAIYELVDGQRNAATIADRLAEGFDDPPDELPDVVVDFLTALADRDLVVFPAPR